MDIRINEAGFRRSISPPGFRLPPGSCDCHIHIVGPFEQYPLRFTKMLNPPVATLADYRNVQAATGLQRTVIVQPSFYATDNACTLDAAQALGADARAVVVIDPATTGAQLREMHAKGARGVRLNNISTGGLTLDLLEQTASRIESLGWHIQLYVDATDVESLAPAIGKLRVPVVFDHMAHVEPSSGTDTPGFQALAALLESGLAWVKLSNALFAASGERARALYAINPERVLWGSDWPHAVFPGEAPDDGVLLDDLASWLPRNALQRVLVDNPAKLYFS